MNTGKKKLYIDAGFGISGDMTVAALLDLGADREVLQKALESLPQEGFSIKISRVKKSSIDCCDFNVLLDAVHENHDHDMDYLYGSAAESLSGTVHEHEKGFHSEQGYGEHVHEGHGHGEHSHGEHSHGEHAHSEHSHEGYSCKESVHGDHELAEHVHHHTHEQRHTHEHAHGGHIHRNLADIRDILAACAMTEDARALANRIFDILAEAEAKAHGVSVSEVHFHEVGAIDSIVDIVAAAVCLDNLGISEVIVPKLGEGQGMVRTQHGLLPVPVPAVQNIAEQYGLDLEIHDAKGEYVTPTGAAFAAAVRTTDQLPKRFRICRTGLGAGKREQQLPGILRMMLIEDRDADREQETEKDQIWKLETNIDDCSGETLGYVLGLLMDAGARDVHYVPAFMKKNRPAWLLNVICTEDKIRELETIIFRETTTIGIRRVPMERTVLMRRNETVSTRFGEIAVKICRVGEEEKIYPEFGSVEAAAKKMQVSLEEVYWEVRNYGKARI
ncbi:MAG: nickel pincer cofactor biosynthesis protein LarC [Eubacteriales bacterium]|nr:nickel pincer cofactor biosynthesis protein LarC [Eubacteriales bacterium]